MTTNNNNREVLTGSYYEDRGIVKSLIASKQIKVVKTGESDYDVAYDVFMNDEQIGTLTRAKKTERGWWDARGGYNCAELPWRFEVYRNGKPSFERKYVYDYKTRWEAIKRMLGYKRS